VRVTHPGTNRAQRALTSFMRQTPLTLRYVICLSQACCASGLESSVELEDCDGSLLTHVSVCLSVTGMPRQ